MEDLGQFKALLDPGLHCILFPLQSIVGRMSLRIQQLDVLCETKTKDNVRFVHGRCRSWHVLRICCQPNPLSTTRLVFFLLIPLLLQYANIIPTVVSCLSILISGVCPGRCCRAIPCPGQWSLRCLLSIDRSPKSDSVVCIRCGSFHRPTHGPR